MSTPTPAQPGRVRIKLAEMLRSSIPTELGFEAFEVEACELWSERSPSRWHDDSIGTWGCMGTAVVDGGVRLSVCLGSYETMTECVKRGFWARWRGPRFASGVDVTGKPERDAGGPTMNDQPETLLLTPRGGWLAHAVVASEFAANERGASAACGYAPSSPTSSIAPRHGWDVPRGTSPPCRICKSIRPEMYPSPGADR